MPGRTHGRLSAGEDRFSAVEIVPVGPPITNNHPLITHHFTVRHLPSVIPPILAHPAPLCGQSPSSDHSVPSCQKFFRVFRVFRGPTLRCPSSVVRRPSSAVSRPIRFLRLLRFFAANPRSSPHPSRSAPEHSRGRNDSASSKTITPALAPSFAIHQSSCEGLRS